MIKKGAKFPISSQDGPVPLVGSGNIFKNIFKKKMQHFCK